MHNKDIIDLCVRYGLLPSDADLPAAITVVKEGGSS